MSLHVFWMLIKCARLSSFDDKTGKSFLFVFAFSGFYNELNFVSYQPFAVHVNTKST